MELHFLSFSLLSDRPSDKKLSDKNKLCIEPDYWRQENANC